MTELVARGHTVTAYARNRAKVPPTWGDRVRVVIGDMSDGAAIDSAIAGADAVVSALGPSMDAKPPACRSWKAPGTSCRR